MHELMFQAGVKGMSERSELIPCTIYLWNTSRHPRNIGTLLQLVLIRALSVHEIMHVYGPMHIYIHRTLLLHMYMCTRLTFVPQEHMSAVYSAHNIKCSCR